MKKENIPLEPDKKKKDLLPEIYMEEAVSESTAAQGSADALSGEDAMVNLIKEFRM